MKKIKWKIGYYLMTGHIKFMRDQGFDRSFTELWHYSGLRLRRMTVFAEMEDFERELPKIEHLYPSFHDMVAWMDPNDKQSKDIVYTEIKHLGKSIIKLLLEKPNASRRLGRSRQVRQENQTLQSSTRSKLGVERKRNSGILGRK